MVYQLNNLSVSYANRVALQNVCCMIEEGKWVSVIGHTGAGKSTFVKVLKGLIPDIAGEYLINDHPVPKDRKGQLKTLPDIGYVFQYPEHQLFESTVYKELAFAPKLRGDTPQQIKKSIETVLWQMGLTEDILPMVPFQLSGGQKRRVAIASVLMMDPKLLILDEPTAGLDPVAHSALLQRLSKWQRQGKRTVLFVSHQMNDVAEYSDEIMVFHEGQLRGHYETGTLFLEQAELLERLGLSLPEPVQLLKIIEEMSGERIEVASYKEQDIFEKVLPIWQARRL